MPTIRRGDRVSFRHDDGRVIEGIVDVAAVKVKGTRYSAIKIRVLTKVTRREPTPDNISSLDIKETVYTVPRLPRYEITLLNKRS